MGALNHEGADLVNLVGNGADPGWADSQYSVWAQVYCSVRTKRVDQMMITSL